MPTAELPSSLTPSPSRACLSQVTPPGYHVDVAGRSHPGKLRARNEDHFGVMRVSRRLEMVQTNLPRGEVPLHFEEYGYVLVIADGMGGMAAGQQASRLALRTGIEVVLESSRWSFRIDENEARELKERLRGYFRKVDQALIDCANTSSDLAGMGTTLTAVYTIGRDAFIVHAGDSRAYLFRNGALRRLTRDHTFAQELADAGRIAPEEVATHARRHVLTNFAGGPRRGIEPEVTVIRLCSGDSLLVCTDGLTEMVDDATIARILKGNAGAVDACEALVDAALAGGGKDNVTVIVANYTIPGDQLDATVEIRRP
ncbi:MAG: serine/threonine-protein phosphatase [Planctomycetota bacterium]|nr:serine/threonine-protein phosphatase [Planctomycetota bacterium]